VNSFNQTDDSKKSCSFGKSRENGITEEDEGDETGVYCLFEGIRILLASD